MPDDKPTLPHPRSPQSRSLLPFIIVVSVIGIAVIFFSQYNSASYKDWDEFIKMVREGQVVKITTKAEFVEAERRDDIEETGTADAKLTKDEPKIFRVRYLGGRLTDEAHKQISEAAAHARTLMPKNAVTISGVEPPGFFVRMLPEIMLLGVLLFLIYFLFLRRMGGGAGGVLNFGKSRAQLITKGRTGKTFKDVAGIEEAKDEVLELVEFLRDPKRFQKLGGRIPRGVLLVGMPGTGKTLLAKAIAGEADVPFYSISGSDFVEMFVGVGASRVRDLFQQAKDNSPCIVFIDEIDAVARRRSAGFQSGGGHDEREQTLNAILVEMDGFSSNDKVIVIAATNRADVLDPALRRPGRFDRQIMVNLPDIIGREQILKVHGHKVRLAPNADLTMIARGTPGFSGADLESLVNEAALHAARESKDAVYHIDLEYARDRIAFGRERKVGSYAMPAEERRITAFHEAGHTVIMAKLPECEDLHKVSIIPRGRALGATMFLQKDRFTAGKKKLEGDICQFFGGRIAESRFCGDITSGASNDIERATEIARAMVYELGMSKKMGPVKYIENSEGFFGAERTVTVSEQTRRELDTEVRSILDTQYERAEHIIDQNRIAVRAIADALLERETLTADEVFVIIDGGQLPPLAHAADPVAPAEATDASTADPVGTKAKDDGLPGTSRLKPDPA